MWSPVLLVISLGLIQNAGIAVLLTKQLPGRSGIIEFTIATLFGMLPLVSGVYAFARAQKLKISGTQKLFLSRALVLVAISLSLFMQYLGWKQVRASDESHLVFFFFPFYAFMAHLTLSQVVLAFYAHE